MLDTFARRQAFAINARSAIAKQSDIFDAAYANAKAGRANVNPYPAGSLSAQSHGRGTTAGELAAILRP